MEKMHLLTYVYLVCLYNRKQWYISNCTGSYALLYGWVAEKGNFVLHLLKKRKRKNLSM